MLTTIACLYYICQANRIEFKSKHRGSNNIPKEAIPNLYKPIGTECGYAIDITFREEKEEAPRIAKLYTKLIKRIEKEAKKKSYT